MSSESKSIEPILREIDALHGRIRDADVGHDDEYRRRQALMLLEGVSQCLRAFCLTRDDIRPYLKFDFKSKEQSGDKPSSNAK